MLNQVVLVGRLAGDPEILEATTGKKYMNVTLAVPRTFKNADGVYETDFIRCVLWNGIPTDTSKFCHKGDIVGIKGRLQNRSYEVQDTKKYITEVIAERITFISSCLKKSEN